jgi:hypothetical protein
MTPEICCLSHFLKIKMPTELDKIFDKDSNYIKEKYRGLLTGDKFTVFLCFVST